MSARLIFDVSGHGFGHLAQTTPVVERLLARRADLEITLRTRVADAIIRERLGERVRIVPQTIDVGMLMASAVEVRAQASHDAHLAFHDRWEATVEADARALDALSPDLLISNIGYRGLEAASRLGIPALAFSSLDWAAVYARYCAALPGADTVLAQMRAAYARARTVLSLEPGLERHGVAQVRRVGPIGARGTRDPNRLRRLVGAGPDERLVLVGPGGIPTRIDMGRWPAPRGIRFLAPAALARGAARVHPVESLPMAYLDVLASSDAVVTKPGYGTFADAACSAVPVVFTRRPDWPEEPRLGEWLARHVATACIDWADLEQGRLEQALETVFAAPARPPAVPTGIDHVADAILAMLESS
jgi:hypothetical protein